MSYPTKYRERVVSYHQEGHSWEETSKIFQVSVSTIRRWENQLKETGNLEPKELHRSFKKIDPDRLKEYIAKNPDAFQYEIAKEFDCAQSAVNKAFKRLNIKRKKNGNLPGAECRKGGGIQ